MPVYINDMAHLQKGLHLLASFFHWLVLVALRRKKAHVLKSECALSLSNMIQIVILLVILPRQRWLHILSLSNRNISYPILLCD